MKLLHAGWPQRVATPLIDLTTVSVVIPALNEAESLARLLPQVAALGVGQTIVGDNGSTDATADVARRHGCTVASAPRRGYGAACAAALERLAPGCRVVQFLDADLADDPRRIPDLCAPILAGAADLVIGARLPERVEPGAMSVPQRFGNALATTLIAWGWGHRYRDLGPFRAIRRTSLERIAMRDRAFGWTVEMQIRALQLGLRVREVPVPYRRRVGVSKISGTVRGVTLAGYYILTTIGRLWIEPPEET